MRGLERRLQRVHVRTGVEQDLRALAVVEHGVEEVLHRHEGVAPHRRLAQRGLQHQVELAADLAHSFSTPALRG